MTNLRDANIFQDFTVWIRDVGKIGECPNFQPPEINISTDDFRGGGMDGTVEIPMGIEKIEFDFEFHTWDANIWAELGYGPLSLDVPIWFRGYLLTPNGVERGVIIETASLIKSIKPGKVEPGKKSSMTIHLSANYYRQEISGSGDVVEIDVFNKITRFGGEDKSQNARGILGFGF